MPVEQALGRPARGAASGGQSRATSIALRPRHDHAGPCMRVRASGLASLAEEALANWFRVRGLSPSVLYHRYGLEHTVVDVSSLFEGAVRPDDEVLATAEPIGVRYFSVRLAVLGAEPERVPLRSRLTVLLVRRPGSFESPPEELAGMLVDGLGGGEGAAAPRLDAAAERSAWRHSGRLPMEACQHAGSVRHSALAQAFATSVEALAEERGLSAKRLLSERGLVSVMPRMRVRLLAPAFAGEVVHELCEVRQLVGETLFDCRFQAHVERRGGRVAVALGSLLHGYARAADPDARPVPLSPWMVERMTGEDRGS
jgi:acyl-CoA thioesterase FadM